MSCADSSNHLVNLFSWVECEIYIGFGKLLFSWSVRAPWGVLVHTVCLYMVHSRRLEQYIRTALEKTASRGCKVHRTFGKWMRTWTALALWMGKATFQLCFSKVLKLTLKACECHAEIGNIMDETGIKCILRCFVVLLLCWVRLFWWSCRICKLIAPPFPIL